MNLRQYVSIAAMALVMIVGLTAAASPQKKGGSVKVKPHALSAADESSVRAVVSEFAATWNRHDMKAMHALNTEDVEWINVVGNHWRGNAAVYRGHDAIHRTICAETTMHVDNVIVRFIDPGVAIAVATMRFAPAPTPSGQVLPEMKTRGSFILVKQGGTWKIAHFQNTTVDPDAEKHDPATWDETGFVPGP